MKEETTNYYSLKLFGLDNYFNNFINLLQKNAFPQVLRIVGDKGYGKFTLVSHILNYFFSNKNENFYNLNAKEINFNSTLYNQIFSGTFENIIILNEEHNSLKIDTLRKLLEKLNKKTTNGQKRYIIIDNADNLNTNVVNALLKVIEEPLNLNHFILIDNKEKKIIETLKSRCLEFKFNLTQIEKKNIVNSLCNYLSINQYLPFDSNLTPGCYLKFNDICLTHSLDANLSTLEKSIKLLNLYKKDKNKNFISLLIFFLSNELLIKKNISEPLIKFNQIKDLINNFTIYNINVNSVINQLRTHLK